MVSIELSILASYGIGIQQKQKGHNWLATSAFCQSKLLNYKSSNNKYLINLLQVLLCDYKELQGFS